ncbi:unnamed protein product [Caenorhabditis brenneri]
MILVPGKIAYNDPSIDGVKLGKAECINTCFENGDCILSYMNSDGYCLQYSYSNLTVLTIIDSTPDDELAVAMKANLVNTDSCPLLSTISDSLYGSTDAGDTFKWTRTESGWFTTQNS